MTANHELATLEKVRVEDRVISFECRQFDQAGNISSDARHLPVADSDHGVPAIDERTNGRDVVANVGVAECLSAKTVITVFAGVENDDRSVRVHPQAFGKSLGSIDHFLRQAEVLPRAAHRVRRIAPRVEGHSVECPVVVTEKRELPALLVSREFTEVLPRERVEVRFFNFDLFDILI